MSKIIRKILCFLGFHKWEKRIGYCSCNGCAWYEDSGLIVCNHCDYCRFCHYCSKPKKREDKLKYLIVKNGKKKKDIENF